MGLNDVMTHFLQLIAFSICSYFLQSLSSTFIYPADPDSRPIYIYKKENAKDLIFFLRKNKVKNKQNV
jgi:hypothetical protein